MTRPESRAEGFLLDLNVLIALAWPHHTHHLRAHEWFAQMDCRWATTPLTESGFLRLSTNPRISARGVLMPEALGVLREIRQQPGHRFLPDDSSLAAPQVSLQRFSASGQTTDMHLVNLAASAGMALATFDRGIGDYLEDADRRYVLLLP